MSSLPTPFQHYTKSSRKCYKTWKGKKGIQIGKGRHKTVFAYREHDLLSRKLLKNWPKNLYLELISNYSKYAGIKVNIQESITFLYARNEQVEFKIKNTVLFKLAPSK